MKNSKIILVVLIALLATASILLAQQRPSSGTPDQQFQPVNGYGWGCPMMNGWMSKGPGSMGPRSGWMGPRSGWMGPGMMYGPQQTQPQQGNSQQPQQQNP